MKNKMEPKKDIDWSKLGFGYTATEYRWQATWENGSWTEDGLVEDPKLHLYESA